MLYYPQYPKFVQEPIFGQLRVIWSPNCKNRKKLRKYRTSAI